MNRFEGKVVIVTGAGRDIGLAVSKAFAREGAKVALIGRSAAAIESAAADICASGATAIAVTCDVSDKAQIYAAVETVVA